MAGSERYTKSSSINIRYRVLVDKYTGVELLFIDLLAAFFPATPPMMARAAAPRGPT
jgi:hypothetical protein